MSDMEEFDTGLEAPPLVSAREVERARYVDPYRLAVRCSCPPPRAGADTRERDLNCDAHGIHAGDLDGTGYEGTAPAPPWVPAVVDGLTALLPDVEWRTFIIPRALKWCEEGEPVYRGEQLLTVARCIPRIGHGVAEGIETWIGLMRKARKGRARSAKRLDHFEPARIRRSYDDPHPPTWGALHAELVIADAKIEASERHVATRETVIDRYRAETKELSEWYARCASACGIEHLVDNGASYPGPIEAVEEAIREGARAIGRVYELQETLTRYTQALTVIACMTKHPSNAATMARAARDALEGAPDLPPDRYRERLHEVARALGIEPGQEDFGLLLLEAIEKLKKRAEETAPVTPHNAEDRS